MRFRLFDIPVRVDATFLVIALIGGYRRIEDIVAWTVAAFVAVLAHELGHALTARAFGVRQIAVTLFALGGVTTYPAEPRLSPRRQFAVSAAGSAVGLLLGGAAFFAGRAGMLDPADRLVVVFATSLVWVGAVLGLLNWLPIRPLDGGQMLTSALELVTTPVRAFRIATAVSVVVGGAAAVLAFLWLSPLAGFFVVLITVMGLRAPAPRAGPARQPSPPRATPEQPPADPSAGATPTDDPEFPI